MKIIKQLIKTVVGLFILLAVTILLLFLNDPDGQYKLDKNLYNNIAKAENYLTLDKVSPEFVEILVANEDRRFYQHSGIDIKRTAGVALADIKAGEFIAGGSTISQQLAKNLYYSSDKSLMRKALELGTALRLEYYFTKDQILEMYINVIYYGSDAYGIKAAAETYYQKSPLELTQTESATLVGLLPAPSLYNPNADAERAAEQAQKALQTFQQTK